MVHYIRYLRTPQVQKVDKRVVDVFCVVAITTDLGDAFYAQDLELVVRIIDATKSGSVLHQETRRWREGDRALKVGLQCPVKLLGRLVTVNTTTLDTIHALDACSVPRVLDVWSLAFTLKLDQRTEPFVERRFLLSNKSLLRVREETGDSIARHVWDASLGFLMYFDSVTRSTNPECASLRTLLSHTQTKKLKVLELGAGCGIVGIAFAQLAKCDIVISDLEDAQSLLRTNIKTAKPVRGASLRTQLLDWVDTFERVPTTKYDLILVSDCIYNPDSSIHLVETLRQGVAWSPNALVLVGYKRRHEADTVFFEHMRKASLEIIESCRLPLPHTLSEYDDATPEFELFIYKMSTNNS